MYLDTLCITLTNIVTRCQNPLTNILLVSRYSKTSILPASTDPINPTFNGNIRIGTVIDIHRLDISN